MSLHFQCSICFGEISKHLTTLKPSLSSQRFSNSHAHLPISMPWKESEKEPDTICPFKIIVQSVQIWPSIGTKLYVDISIYAYLKLISR